MKLAWLMSLLLMLRKLSSWLAVSYGNMPVYIRNLIFVIELL